MGSASPAIGSSGSQAQSDLKDQVKVTAVQAILLQNYCTQVITQPQIDLSAISSEHHIDAGQHLKTAKSHASDFLDHVKPKMFTVLADVVDYADTFSGFQDSFKDALSRWAQNSPNAQQDLGDLIGALKGEIDTKLANVQAVVVSLTNFRDNLLADSSAFNTDALQVNAMVNGDNGEIADLQAQLEEIQSKITGEIVGVAIGSAAIVGGGILIVVGAATSVFGGAGVPVAILGGVLVATGVAVDIGVGSALVNYENLKSALAEKLATLKGEIVALTAVGATISQLAKSIDGAIEVANGLVTTWDSLSAEMGNLERTITRAQDGDKAGKLIVVSAFLTTANNQWNDVHNLAVDIQTRFSSLNTEHVGELNSKNVNNAARRAA